MGILSVVRVVVPLCFLFRVSEPEFAHVEGVTHLGIFFLV